MHSQRTLYSVFAVNVFVAYASKGYLTFEVIPLTMVSTEKSQSLCKA